MFKKHLSKILIFSLALLFLLIVILMLALSKNRPPTVTTSTPTSTPTPTTESFITQPVSKWASDDIFINLEKEVIQTEKDLQQVTRLKEDELKPPDLDLNVRY